MYSTIFANVFILFFLIICVVVYLVAALIFYKVQKHLRKEGITPKLVTACCILLILCAVCAVLLFCLYLLPTFLFLFPTM